ncbi:MAG: hypothetical protein HYT87_12575 [Nitrospirae bacterium]|nr:hypothetical protein [Nitrospirota bacterium]
MDNPSPRRRIPIAWILVLLWLAFFIAVAFFGCTRKIEDETPPPNINLLLHPLLPSVSLTLEPSGSRPPFRWEFLQPTSRGFATTQYRWIRNAEVSGILFAEDSVAQGGSGNLILATEEGLLIALGRIRDGRTLIMDGYFFKFPAQLGETYEMNSYITKWTGGRRGLGQASTPRGAPEPVVKVSREKIDTARGEQEVVVYSLMRHDPEQGDYESKWYFHVGEGLVRAVNSDHLGQILVQKGFESPAELGQRAAIRKASHPNRP